MGGLIIVVPVDPIVGEETLKLSTDLPNGGVAKMLDEGQRSQQNIHNVLTN